MNHGSFVIEKLFKHYNVHVEQLGNDSEKDCLDGQRRAVHHTLFRTNQ